MPDLQWDDLRYFLAVARSRTFTHAARDLRVHQSTVSRRVAALEETLGAALFLRHGAELTLTAVGERLVRDAEGVEGSVGELLVHAATSPTALEGKVRVATLDELAAFVVLPTLPAFLERCPDIEVEVLAGPRIVDLGRRDADVALRPSPPREGDMVSRKVAVLRFAPFASVDYLARVGLDRDLATLDWLTLDETMRDHPDAVWVQTTAQGRSPRLRASGRLALAAAASAGAGAAVLPLPLARQFPNLRRLGGGVVLERDVHLVAHRDVRDLARVRAVMSWLTDAARLIEDEGSEGSTLPTEA